ncbi:MAG: GNAT family N-acetyltransferase [Dehalococcoidia bacterium]|nr:GNAT family N-acetyltransferase [Dehalococcoidia bacterium]
MGTPVKAPNLTVRAMEPDDIPDVMEIDRLSGSRRAITYQGQIDFFLGGELGLSYVAELDGRTVGFLMGRILERRYAPYQGAWVEILGVSPDLKRQGIGRRLLEVFLEGCREKGVQEVHAVASIRDMEVKPFLEAHGFKEGELVHLHKQI